MTDQGYDELSTKREMVRLLAKDATAEQLDAAIYACLDNRLNDEDRRTGLIQTIYSSWYERLSKRARAPGADVTVQWQDVERMFRDVLAIVGAPRSSLPPTSSDKKSELQGMAAPMARLPGVPAHAEDSAMLEHIRRAL